jgi:hypothetical protein
VSINVFAVRFRCDLIDLNWLDLVRLVKEIFCMRIRRGFEVVFVQCTAWKL